MRRRPIATNAVLKYFKDKVPTCIEWCRSAEECMGHVFDVKKIQEEAKKRAAADGNPEFFDQVTEMIKKEERRCIIQAVLHSEAKQRKIC